jgi:signal transduction histidine kinase/CheY-like chemotaxis protein/AraC-like DNA-binding protein
MDTVIFGFDTVKNVMTPIKFDRPSIGKIAEIDFDDNNRLWTLSIGGVLRVFAKKGTIYHQLRVFDEGVNIFHLINHRIFFSKGAKELCEITSDFHIRELLSIKHYIHDIQYFQGHYFVAWLYKGLLEFDANFKPVDDILRFCPELKDNEISGLTETEGKTLWVTTNNRGIFKIRSRPETFGLINEPKDSLITNSNVEAIQKIGDELWLGTRNNGIIKILTKNGKTNHISNINPVNSLLDREFNSYYSIKKGNDNNYYIGSDAMGITIYNPSSKTFFRWSQILGTQTDEEFYSIRCLLPQKDSSFYAGCIGGVYHFKVSRLNDGKLKLIYAKNIKTDAHFLQSGNNSVNALEDMNDWLLIGYRFSGLCLLNKVTGKTINLGPQPYIGCLPTNNILSLLVDKKGRVWIGTSDGLFWINKDDLLRDNPKFHRIDNKNGLPDNNVHAIENDNEGNIWLSTNQGLAKINDHSFKVIQYRVEDGLQNAEFSDNSVFKDNNNMYFGGITGYNYFDPAKVSTDKTLSNLLITDFNIAGKTLDGIQLIVVKPQVADINREYQLTRNENYFSLKVQPTDGYTNIIFQYQCFLQGYDLTWRESRENNRIDYSNIPPGDYSFYIKWSNGQGEWSSVRRIFHIQIRQYFWLTNIAKMLYALLAGIALYVYYLTQKGRQEIKNRLLLENLVRVKEKKLYQEKMEFFTNITHELQTPLTLILGSIERYFHKNESKDTKHKGWNFLQIANQEAFRLQYLIHQLLEFRKGEAGHLSIQTTGFNVSNLITNITELFAPIGEKNNLQLSVSITENILVTSDKDKIEKIVFNLLSNAFKYTKTEGFIDVVVLEDTERKTMQMIVANSGFTGPNDNLNLLFEQFYTLDQVNQSKISSGIGLAFSKQLVELLGGSISVKAENHWITFSVILPLTVKNSIVSNYPDLKSSEKPSYLVKSAIGDHFHENRVGINNDLAIIENLSNTNKKTVLIVDDEPSIRHLIREILADIYIVYEAENGNMALDMARKTMPNLIVSDVMMDGIDGLKFCSAIKNTPETCHIPFLLLSALASSDQRVDGFEAGADAYLTKPFSAKNLISKIEQLLKYREQIQQYFKQGDFADTPIDTGLKVEDRAFLEKVMKIINDNIANSDLDTALLENAMLVSRMSFYRKIKAFTNMTPVELIKHVRLKYAAHLLKTSALTVSEIYYQTGFNNQSYFYREFKRVYMYSPKEFREQQNSFVISK